MLGPLRQGLSAIEEIPTIESLSSAFIYTPEERPRLSSRERYRMKINADGSVDLYIGPKAPKGYENNWIPTGGRTPFLLARFYGPTETLFNKTFVLNDVELVKEEGRIWVSVFRFQDLG